MSAAIDIPGQPFLSEYFSRALASDSLSHAYLLVGASPAARRAAGEALARALGVGIEDFHELAPAGVRVYKVEQVRELIRDAGLAPVKAERKVYLLLEAESLGRSAANALLKELEEPTASVLFILCASRREQVLPTISSRAVTLALQGAAADPPELDAELVHKVGKLLGQASGLTDSALLDQAHELAALKDDQAVLEAIGQWLVCHPEPGYYRAVSECRRQINYNVSAELAFDAMLLQMKSPS
ncbi:MAG: hypothetical protein LBL67_01725 [Coriobacteriales bacterium]|jgi:DNA polymerase III delta prime subunit|nr:hypothetical protein [Coriobacteriales bacterium]